MKKLLYTILAVAAVVAASCSKNTDPNAQGHQNLVTVSVKAYAIDDSKTVIDGQKVNWEAGDKISVFDSNTLTNYEFTALDSGSLSDFTGDVDPSFLEADSYLAVYPYNENNSVADDAAFAAGKVETNIPALQYAPVGSADPAAIVTVAKCGQERSFSFKHVCGFVRLTLKASDNITSVKLIGEPDMDSETNLCDAFVGDVTVTVGDEPALELSTSRSKTGLVELCPAEGDTFVDGEYYIAVAPVTMARGFRLYFQRSTDSREALKAGTNPLEIARKGGKDLGTISFEDSDWLASVKDGQTDVYVSVDGTADGSSAGSAMSFADFKRLIDTGDAKSHSGLYPLFAWKTAHFLGRTFHFAAGTYNFTQTLSTYFSGQSKVDFAIEGPEGDAPAVVFDGGSACRILYLNSSASVAVRNVKFQNGKANYGAAVWVKGSQQKCLENCVFDNNKATAQAGAVYVDEVTGKLDITDCVFTNNVSGTNAGALRNKGIMNVRGCLFEGNKAVGTGTEANAGTGGAMYIGEDDSETLVEDCTFKNNKTEGEFATIGGAINVQNKKLKAVIKNCTFEGNSAKTRGGAIQINGASSDVKVEGGSFSSNVAAEYGGAVYSATNGVIDIEGATFTGNHSTNGGAVASYGNVTLNNCTFKENYASTGGAIRIYKSALILNGGAFEDNYTSENSGGAIYVGDDNSSIIATGVTFANNKSKTTGGAVNFQDKIITGSFVDCIFTGNTATTNSGTFHVAGGTSEFTFTDCLFSGNVAKSNGGVTYVSVGTVKFNDCTFRDNSGKQGGVFYIGTGKCYMNACVMTGNTNSATGASTANAIVGTSSSGYIGLHNCTVYTPASAKGDADVKFGGTSGPNGAVTCCTIVSDCATTGHLALASAYTATKGGIDKAVVMANIIKENAGTAAVGGYLPSKGYNLFNSGAFNASATGDSNAVPALTATPSQSGLVYYLWDGNVTPKTTKNDIQAAIKASHATFGEVFDEFITACGGYGKDVAGNTRSISAIWPGSYQAE